MTSQAVSPALTSPAAGASGAALTQQTFVLTFSDNLGSADIGSFQVNFGGTDVTSGICALSYSGGLLGLFSDNGSQLLQTMPLMNSQCVIGDYHLAPSGNTLRFTVSITFLTPFEGLREVYALASAGSTGDYAPWVDLGSYGVNVPTQQTYIISSTGASSWTAPTGVTSATVECWGPGGSGANAALLPYAGTSYYFSGGGGGGGAYAKKSSVPVVPGANYAIVVGAGGSGTRTTFGGSTVAADAGQNGSQAIGGGNNGGAGGVGGLVANSIGDASSLQAGSSGSAGGSTFGGAGGNGGSGGVGGTGGTSAPYGNGYLGTAPGGGGGGAAFGGSFTGGGGGAGQVVITYFGPPVATYSISGRVTLGGLPLAGVSIALSGDQTDTVATDANGNYGLSNLKVNGNFTITASKFGYTLSAAQTFTTLVANQAASFTATANSYLLTTAISPAGAGSVTAGGSYAFGSTVQLTAYANPGYQFSGFSGSSVGTSNPFTATITGPMAVTANFTAAQASYTLTTSVSPAGGGTISPACSGGCSYSSGTLVSLTANANAGYQFTGFSGGLTGGSPGYVTMNSNKALTANCVSVSTPSLVISSAPTGLSLTVDGSVCVSPCSFNWAAGTSHTVAAASQSGVSGTQYIFGNWSDGGSGSHTITARSTVPPYVANFTTQYYLTTSASPAAGGAVSPPNGWYSSGTLVTVSTSTNAGYQFSGFTGGATGATAPAYLTMNAPKTVTANFATQGSALTPNLNEMAMLSLFVKRHTSLVAAGSSPPNGGLYGLPDTEVATVNSAVDSASQQLDQIQSQASSYSDGNAYLSARNTVLQNLKSQLQSNVSTSSWQTLDGYMNTTLAPGLSAQSLDGSNPPRALAQTPNRCDPTAVNCMFLWSEINFYNGGGSNHGLGARIESWVEGPNARDYTSTVSQVKESFTPLGSSTAQVIFSPRDVTVVGGGHAGAVNTDWTGPSAGTYKIEAFHRFTYTYTDATGTHTEVYPPFPSFIFGDPPPSPASRSINPLNGYEVYQTPVSLNLTVDGAQLDSSGQTATVIGCSAPITVNAVLTPPVPIGNSAPPITWTGGLPMDNLHRSVPCVLGSASISAAIGPNLQISRTVTVSQPLIKFEQVGETVISQDGNYSEDTTIRVTAVNGAGQTVTTFTGTVGIVELGSDNYSQNGGTLPPSVEITNGGTTTFVAKSLAGPFNSATPPLVAMITSSNFAVYGGQSFLIPQWIISGQKVDPRAGDGVYDWLQYRVKDIFAKYTTNSDVNTVLSAIRSFDMAYIPGVYAITAWGRSATSPITVNPFYGVLRLDSAASVGICGLPASSRSLTNTVLHEGRHAYQASLTIIPNNDKDQDFLPSASLIIPPTDIMRDTTDPRTVCDTGASLDNQLSQRGYKGDVSYPVSFDVAESPDFARYAWEFDAWSFASLNEK